MAGRKTGSDKETAIVRHKVPMKAKSLQEQARSLSDGDLARAYGHAESLNAAAVNMGNRKAARKSLEFVEALHGERERRSFNRPVEVVASATFRTRG